MSRRLSELSGTSHSDQTGLLDMVVELQAGDTFASAAASHPEAFPRYYVAVLESAELTGTLDTVLLELATYLETISRPGRRSRQRSSIPPWWQ